MTPNEQEVVRVGQKAAQELELCDRFFANMREEIVQQIIEAAYADVQARESLCLTLKTLDGLKTVLHQAVAAGENTKAIADYVETIAQPG